MSRRTRAARCHSRRRRAQLRLSMRPGPRGDDATQRLNGLLCGMRHFCDHVVSLFVHHGCHEEFAHGSLTRFFENPQRGANTGHPGIKQTLHLFSSVRDVLTYSSYVERRVLRSLASAVSWTVLPAECVPIMIACPTPTTRSGKYTINIFAMCDTPSFLSSGGWRFFTA